MIARALLQSFAGGGPALQTSAHGEVGSRKKKQIKQMLREQGFISDMHTPAEKEK
jgi:hypothetical protein